MLTTAFNLNQWQGLHRQICPIDTVSACCIKYSSRTRACGLYQSGVELELVSRILGHTSTQTTRIYASPSIEMLKTAMENVSVDISEAAEWIDNEEELAIICGVR